MNETVREILNKEKVILEKELEIIVKQKDNIESKIQDIDNIINPKKEIVKDKEYLKIKTLSRKVLFFLKKQDATITEIVDYINSQEELISIDLMTKISHALQREIEKGNIIRIVPMGSSPIYSIKEKEEENCRKYKKSIDWNYDEYPREGSYFDKTKYVLKFGPVSAREITNYICKEETELDPTKVHTSINSYLSKQYTKGVLNRTKGTNSGRKEYNYSFKTESNVQVD